jgi:hypothetical protein
LALSKVSNGDGRRARARFLVVHVPVAGGQSLGRVEVHHGMALACMDGGCVDVGRDQGILDDARACTEALP